MLICNRDSADEIDDSGNFAGLQMYVNNKRLEVFGDVDGEASQGNFYHFKSRPMLKVSYKGSLAATQHP